MKKQLLKKISACLPVGIAFITLVMFCAIANAQIVYTDVIPDTMINSNGGIYNLDLNDDSITDFRITFTTSSGCGGNNINIRITPLDSNAVGNTSTLPSALNLNAVIDSSSFDWRNNSNQILARLEWFTYGRPIPTCRRRFLGNWNGLSNRYIPLQLNLNSQKYYGWVRLDVASNVASFTVKDYAYNTKPNLRILAGDTSCSAPKDSLTSSGSLTICSGDSVQFKTLTHFSYQYQWFKDGKAISGANSSSYTAFNKGAYYVNVSNSCGNVNSTIDTISIFAVNTSVTVSGDTLTANAESATYQWMDCSTLQTITGATAKTFLPSQNGSFAVIVTENSCSDTSSCYTVCIAPTVAITLNGPLSICSGDGVQFNATTNFSYNYFQWFKDGNAISGANSSSYTDFSAGAYYVNVRNSCGSVNSTTDTVSIVAVDTSVTVKGNTFTANAVSAKFQWIDCYAHKIIPGATSQSFTPTQNGSFAVIVTENSCSDTSSCYIACFPPTVSVAASGPQTICRGEWVQFNATTDFSYQYQWFKDGNAISGANTSLYKAFSAGAYYVNVSNSCGNVNSTIDTVSIVAVDTSVTVKGNIFTANAVSAKYQWFDCSAQKIIPGATSQSFTPTQNGSFAVIVTENSCSDTSSCYIACFPPTVSVAASGPQTICRGEWVQFNATTGFSFHYQWFKDGNAISGANTSLYKAFSAGAYYVNVSNSCGNVNSDVDSVSVFAVNSLVTVSGNKLIANAASATYQWIDCSTMQIIPGATAQTFSPSQNGSFAVIVTENSCKDTSSCYSIISTGIHENIFASSITLYPNPTSNHLSIDLGSTKQKVELTITEIAGKVMFSTIASEMQKIEVSTQDFKAGIYVVQIQTEDFIISKKLVVKK